MELSETNAVPQTKENNVTRFQYFIVVSCALCMVVDGFDVQSMSYAAPALMKVWGIDRSILGPVLSAGLFGMLVGSALLAGVADRVGRRPTLIVALTWVAVSMAVTPLALSIGQLVALRFVTGLGMGVVIPNAFALAGEYSPRRVRTLLVMVVASGYTVGGVVGGAVAALVIGPFGWASVFYSGAALTGSLALLTLLFVPESLQFCLLRRPDNRKTVDRIRKFGLEEDLNQSEQASRKDNSLKVVFGHGRFGATAVLWIASFCNMVSAYFLASWIPVLMSGSGYSAHAAILAGMALWGGGIFGNFILGYLIDRTRYGRVMFATFIVGAIAIAGLACFTHSPLLAFPLILVAGFVVMGGQSGFYAISVLFYPTRGRSTGAGLVSGVGRIGGVLGPILGGKLMALSWASDQIVLVSALPLLVTAVAIAVFASLASRTSD